MLERQRGSLFGNGSDILEGGTFDVLGGGGGCRPRETSDCLNVGLVDGPGGLGTQIDCGHGPSLIVLKSQLSPVALDWLDVGMDDRLGGSDGCGTRLRDRGLGGFLRVWQLGFLLRRHGRCG